MAQPVGSASSCHAGVREVDSGRTNTHGLKIKKTTLATGLVICVPRGEVHTVHSG